MEIHIDDGKRIEDVRNEFTERFPFLKIEFFNSSHKEGAGSPKEDMITEDVTIGDVRSKHNEGNIKISGEMPVGEVEQVFEKNYGIHVQVFRKSGDIWLETSATDSWTLNEQNTTGEEMS